MTVGKKKVTFFCPAFTQTIQILQCCYVKTLRKDICLGLFASRCKSTCQNLCMLMPKDWYDFHKCASSYLFTELGPKPYISLSDCPMENCKLSIFKTAQSGSIKVLCLQRFPDRHFNCINLWLRNEAGPAVNILCKYKPFKQEIIKINGNKEIF